MKGSDLERTGQIMTLKGSNSESPVRRPWGNGAGRMKPCKGDTDGFAFAGLFHYSSLYAHGVRPGLIPLNPSGVPLIVTGICV